MAKALTKAEYEALEPFVHPVANTMYEQQEWYVDRHVIGVVVQDKIDRDWGAVVQGKDLRGRFRAVDMKVGCDSPQAARKWLEARMVVLGRQQVFSQGDEHEDN